MLFCSVVYSEIVSSFQTNKNYCQFIQSRAALSTHKKEQHLF